MSDSALNVWKEIYKIDNVKDKTSFEAIDLLLNGFSASKRNKILVEVFSTFKSTFIAYRFIYFNFIKEKIPEDEKVKVLNPYDLELIDVKNNIDFQKVKKPSGSSPSSDTQQIRNPFVNRQHMFFPSLIDFHFSTTSFEF